MFIRMIDAKWKWFLLIGVFGFWGLMLWPVSPKEPLGVAITESQIISKIQQLEESYLTTNVNNGKYLHLPKTSDWKKLFTFTNEIPFFIEVNEYLKPDGQTGYWIVIENNDYIKSVGYGVDASMHTWEIIKDKTIWQNTTST